MGHPLLPLNFKEVQVDYLPKSDKMASFNSSYCLKPAIKKFLLKTSHLLFPIREDVWKIGNNGEQTPETDNKTVSKNISENGQELPEIQSE